MNVFQNNPVGFSGNPVGLTPGAGYQRLKWALLTSCQIPSPDSPGNVGDTIPPTEDLMMFLRTEYLHIFPDPISRIPFLGQVPPARFFGKKPL